jgi:hypothetical protein
MIVVVFLFHRCPNMVVRDGFLLIVVSIMVVRGGCPHPRSAFGQSFLSSSYFS